MQKKRRLLVWTMLTVAGGIVGSLMLGVSLQPFSGYTADHRDAPGVQSDVTTDITDVYAFRSPSNSDNLVAVLNVSPHAPGAPPTRPFSNEAQYQIHVNKDGDLATDEALVTVTFSGDPQKWKVEGLTTTAIDGDVTPIGTSTPIVFDQGGIKVFCGPRDDPFFFDLVGFKNFLAGPFVPIAGNGLRPSGQMPIDSFAGANVGSIVLEFPIIALTGASTSNTGVIEVWASTSKVTTAAPKILGPLNP